MTDENRIIGFEPIARSDAMLLILGTMPSVASLEDQFYYAHPRNAFWQIQARILNEPIPVTHDEKRGLLIRHNIALWDVAKSCVRPGSLDGDIRDVIPNDFSALFARCQRIRKILFNGTTAQKLYEKHVRILPEGCAFSRMPSTSPAYTLKFERKVELWREGMEGYYG